MPESIRENASRGGQCADGCRQATVKAEKLEADARTPVSRSVHDHVPPGLPEEILKSRNPDESFPTMMKTYSSAAGVWVKSGSQLRSQQRLSFKSCCRLRGETDESGR
jgi:hypothetical protein